MEDRKKITAIRLKQARENVGYSLSEMSKAMNGELIPSRISNYEQGIRAMPVSVALSISKTLGVSAAYLLGVDDNSESAFNNLGDSEKKLFKLLAKVSAKGEDEIERISRMIKAYLATK